MKLIPDNLIQSKGTVFDAKRVKVAAIILAAVLLIIAALIYQGTEEGGSIPSDVPQQRGDDPAQVRSSTATSTSSPSVTVSESEKQKLFDAMQKKVQ